MSGSPRLRPAHAPAVRGQRRQSGIAQFEVVLTGIMIALLFLFGLNRLLPLRGQAEEAAVVGSIGAMQASLGSEVAARVLRDGVGGLPALGASNPVDLLLKPPGGYKGAFAQVDTAALKPGEWAFDTSRGVLVYRVRHVEYFHGSAMDPPRGEWQITLHYAGDVQTPANLRGVLLQALVESRWTIDPD